MRMLLAVIVLVSLAGAVEAQAPIIIGPNGQYLGNLSANPYDPNSVANPYGRYGSRFSPDSINNPGLIRNLARRPRERLRRA